MSLKKKTALKKVPLSAHEATRLLWLHVMDIPEDTFSVLCVLEKDPTKTEAFCKLVYQVLLDCNLFEVKK